MTIKSIGSHTTSLAIMMFGFMLGIPNLTHADFKFKTIDFPDSTLTEANGNSTKQIVGDFDDVDGNTHGYVGIFKD